MSIRSPFKIAARRPQKLWDGPMPTPRDPVVVGPALELVCEPIAKEVKARPGKRTPTKVEAEWMARIVAHGCIACRADGNGVVAPHVHHILRGGRRIGHLFTLPLCPSHHQDDGSGFVARHPYKTRFEQKYGAELWLLANLKRELGVFDKAEYV